MTTKHSKALLDAEQPQPDLELVLVIEGNARVKSDSIETTPSLRTGSATHPYRITGVRQVNRIRTCSMLIGEVPEEAAQQDQDRNQLKDREGCGRGCC